MLKTYFVLCSFLLIVTEVVRCKADYVFNLKAVGWLKLHTTPATFEDAFLKCHRAGAVLASPLSEEIANALQSQLARSHVTGHIYLGTHDLYSKGHYASVEGMPLSDMGDMNLQLESHNNGTTTGDCLTMTADGRVYYSSCVEPLPFICYKRLGSQAMNECGSFDNEYQLNQVTRSCYKVHREKLAWNAAYGVCTSEGAYLVILNDDEEARIIRAMFPSHTGKIDRWEQFHIGLTAWGPGRSWVTIHGDKIEDVFNDWDQDEPDNLGGIQYRATFRRLTSALDDISVNTEAMFVCEKSPDSIPPLIIEEA